MKHKYLTLMCVVIIGSFLITGPVLAQIPDDYEVSWWVLSGGGGTSEDGDDYLLSGIIGQVATDVLSSGEFSVIGGILTDESIAQNSVGGTIYLPVILRNQ